MHNVVKWPNTLLKSCGVYIARFLKYVWPFYNIMHEGMKGLTICTSIASCEQFSSKLKLILTHLRSTMTQQRPWDLAKISIERSTADKIDFTKILKEFSNVKTRKNTFYQDFYIKQYFSLHVLFFLCNVVKELPTRAELFQFYP